jgi:hypothetical protein
MKKMVIMVAVLGLLIAGPLAGACFGYGVIVDGGGPGFATYTAGNTPGPYFNNNSRDGVAYPAANNLNVGFYIQGNATTNSPALGAANANWAANATTTSNIWFSDGAGDAIKLLKLASDSGITSFGYYQVNADGSLFGGVLTTVEIFAAGSPIAPAAGSELPVPLPSYFGLYLTVGANTFYSDQTILNPNTTDAGYNHFAVFEDSTNPGILYIGMEDSSVSAAYGGLTDHDYNDMVVQLSPVPLPGALLLLGGGLVRLLAYSRRRKAAA